MSDFGKKNNKVYDFYIRHFVILQNLKAELKFLNTDFSPLF